MSDDQDKAKRQEGHLDWQFLLRLPSEWREPLQEMASRTTRPMGRRQNVSDAIRMLIYKGLKEEGLIEDEQRD